jgi:hypothetical protein
MDDQERQQALEDAVRDAVATHAHRLEAPPAAAAPARREAPLIACILVGWAVIGWIWLAEPAMIFGPKASVEATAAEREARLRFGMYLQHQEIVAFTQDSGRLPHSLAELEIDPADGVRLEFDQQGRWALVGSEGELTLRLTEAMSADSFLGTSLATLEGSR